MPSGLNTYSTVSQTGFTSHSHNVTVNSDKLILVVGLSFGATYDCYATAKVENGNGGIPLTQVYSYGGTSYSSRTQMFYLDSPPQGSQTITVEFTGTSGLNYTESTLWYATTKVLAGTASYTNNAYGSGGASLSVTSIPNHGAVFTSEGAVDMSGAVMSTGTQCGLSGGFRLTSSASTGITWTWTGNGVAGAAFFAAEPSITDVDTDNEIDYNQTGVLINGDDLGTGTVEIGDASTYGACVTKVSQTVNSTARYEIDFNVVPGALSYGTNWVYVTVNGEVSPGKEIVLFGPPPTITDVDTDEVVRNTQAGVVLTGTGLSGATLELCNNVVYASATIKVSQSVNSTGSTTVNFDASKGTLEYGQCWAFVTNTLGQQNTTGFPINLITERILAYSFKDQTGNHTHSGMVISGNKLIVSVTTRGTSGADYYVNQIYVDDSGGPTYLTQKLHEGNNTVDYNHAAIWVLDNPPAGTWDVVVTFTGTEGGDTPSSAVYDCDDLMLGDPFDTDALDTYDGASLSCSCYNYNFMSFSAYAAAGVTNTLSNGTQDNNHFGHSDLCPSVTTEAHYWSSSSGAYDSAVLAVFLGIPKVTDVDTDEEIDYNQTGVELSGEAIGGATALEIGDAGTYGSCVEIETQTINSNNGLIIDFDVVQGALTPGDVWAYVTVNGTTGLGFQITLFGPLPTITDVDTDEIIEDTQTGVIATCTGLVTTGATLELADNSDYGSATTIVPQTVNSNDDTSVNFDVVRGALDNGTVYAFVTNFLSQRNATGFAVTLRVHPIITDIDTDEEIFYNQNNVIATGTDLDIVSTLELCNNSDYSLATIKVTQAINTQNATTIDFDVVPGTLPYGTVYAFATTAIGGQNSSGFAVVMYGPEPNITDVDTDEVIDYNQAGVVMTGTTFLPSTGTLELCDNSDYGSATKFISQTVNTWGDTSIDFDVVPGTLDWGPVYAFVTTTLSQRNTVGFEVILMGPLPTITDVDTDEIVDDDQENVVLTGTNFLTLGLELLFCDNADYDLATKIVSQSIDSNTTTTIDFDVVKGTLDHGDVWVFVSSTYGGRNTTGFQIYMVTTTDSEEYSLEADCPPLIPGTLSIYLDDGVISSTLSDDGAGNITGDGTGTIDYDYGQMFIVFTAPYPKPGTTIYVDYDPVEGGCDCGDRCFTSLVKLDITPGAVSGQTDLELGEAWDRLIAKIRRDILPINSEILVDTVSISGSDSNSITAQWDVVCSFFFIRYNGTFEFDLEGTGTVHVDYGDGYGQDYDLAASPTVYYDNDGTVRRFTITGDLSGVTKLYLNQPDSLTGNVDNAFYGMWNLDLLNIRNQSYVTGSISNVASLGLCSNLQVRYSPISLDIEQLTSLPLYAFINQYSSAYGNLSYLSGHKDMWYLDLSYTDVVGDIGFASGWDAPDCVYLHLVGLDLTFDVGGAVPAWSGVQYKFTDSLSTQAEVDRLIIACADAGMNNCLLFIDGTCPAPSSDPAVIAAMGVLSANNVTMYFS